MSEPNWYDYVIKRLNDIDARIRQLESQKNGVQLDVRYVEPVSPWAPDWNPPPQPGA